MNKYEYIKSQVPAKELVKHFLREPQKISGESYKWESPFRDGDHDPSLVADDKFISDFGDKEFIGKDIFNFVARYKNISEKEAVDYIVSEFNIDISAFDNTKKSINLPIVTKKLAQGFTKKFSLEKSENVVEEIYAMFDEVQYEEKPTGDEIGKIKNRISKLEAYSYTLDDIKNCIIHGQTCIPSAIKSNKDWKDGQNYLQLFMVDVDNAITVDGKKQNITVDDENHVTVDKILNYCESINLPPTFVYYTFSHSENQHKFRLVYVLDCATQESKTVTGIYDFLKETFRDYNIDNAPTSLSTMFLGGQSIAFESDNFYQIKTIEEHKSEDNIQVIDNHELALCDKSLKDSSYIILGNQLGIIKKSEFIPISNFVTYISEKQNYINGRDTETKYLINCILLENPNIKIPTLPITIEQYSKFNFVLGSSWDKYAIIKAGTSNPEKLREVTQLISRNTMIEKNIYAHTGFTRIDGKLVFLYHGGFIGTANNIEVDLSSEKQERFCFTDKTFDIKEALKLSLSFLDLADYKITIPILATIYLAPIYSFLEEVNIHADYILYVQGKTGTRKSSLVALALCHYGEFDRDHFPSSFRDTLNSIEKRAFMLKDLVNVVDDFNPEINGKQKLETLEKLYAMYGDRVGRTRMSKDGMTLKLPYTARGLCIVTGEATPDVAQSRIARSIFVTIKQDSLDLDKLTVLQNNPEPLAFAMKQFISWGIDHELEIKEFAKTKFSELRAKQNNEYHGRSNEIINVLTIGFSLFLKFLLENSVITHQEQQELEKKCYEVLYELVEEQTQTLQELKPTEMFYNAVEQLFASNSIHVLDSKDGTHVDELSYGGTNVGFYNRNEHQYLFFPDVIYNEVVNFYSKQNIKFPINKTTLWKYLDEEGQLYRNDKTRYTMKRSVNKVSHTIVAIKAQDMRAFSSPVKKYKQYDSNNQNSTF